MSKKPSRTQASSSRVSSASNYAFGDVLKTSSAFGSASSALSYLAEQPDLSTLNDSNVVVNFKNLSKKDSTTRTKALEELQNYAKVLEESRQEADESLLSAWDNCTSNVRESDFEKVKVYPRTSIDSDRRVRQLAHSTHGFICAISGRRVAKYMPVVVGAWVAGCHDSDRSVSRVANEAFARVFVSQEKLGSINKLYQVQILEFCQDVFFNETPQTLSDERTTKVEDSDAKYAHLAASCLTVVHVLLEKLTAVEVEKQQSLYEAILGDKVVWQFAGSADSSVRRALYKLVQSAFVHRKGLIEPHANQFWMALLSKQAMKRQGGSALDYSASLLTICLNFPVCWSNSSKGLSDMTPRFTELVRHGSQGASSAYWDNLFKMFQTIPDELRWQTASDAMKFLGALRVGITRKDEPRSNAESAWSCFIAALKELLEGLPADERERLLASAALPLLRQFLEPNSEDSEWTILAPRSSHLLAELFQAPLANGVVSTTWTSMTENFTNAIRTLSPEQSQGFDASQAAIAKRSSRWFELQRELQKGSTSEHLVSTFDQSTTRILNAAMETLRSRNGKPYGAAQVLEEAIQASESLLSTKEAVNAFIVRDLPELIYSPSRFYLISILYRCRDEPCFEQGWNQTTNVILEIPDLPQRQKALIDILCTPNVPTDFTLALEDRDLQAYFSTLIDQALEGRTGWTDIAELLQSPAQTLSATNWEKIIVDLTQRLSIDTTAPNALSGLEMMTARDPAQLNEHATADEGAALMQNLLQLSESPNEDLAQRAAILNERITSAEKEAGVSGGVAQVTRSVLTQGLSVASRESVSIETLVNFAKKDLNVSSRRESLQLSSLLPDLTIWQDSLRPILNERVPQALAISSSLGDPNFLIEYPTADPVHETAGYDKDGYSASIRMALFTVGILEDTAVWQSLTYQVKSELYRLLILTSQLANDNLTLAGANSSCTLHGVESENDIADLVTSVHKLFASWIAEDPGAHDALEIPEALTGGLGSDTSTDFISIAHRRAFEDSKGRSCLAFHNSRLFGRYQSELIETRGWRTQRGFDVEGRFKDLRKGSNPMSLMAFLMAFNTHLGSTSGYARVCNELVASLTGLDASSNPDEALQQLLLLNSMLQAQDHIIDGIAKQRVIFLIKHISPWLQEETHPIEIRVETSRLLALLLPAVQDVYGDHWAAALDFVRQTCETASEISRAGTELARLPLINSALRLLASLRSLQSDDDVNEDLKDSWQDVGEVLSSALVSLLKCLSVLPDANNQPLRTVNELLGRQIAASPSERLDEIADLYQLVTAESRPVQRTAFSLLHKRIPAMQEQISLDVALEKSIARLPDELLSLIVDAPTPESLVDTGFEREMPSQARGYLSAWLLMFDHFKNASEKVRTDYIAQIKEGSYLDPLLDFTTHVLGHSRGKPVDASKVDISIYSFDVTDSPIKDLQWLLIHLYYLCLKHLPSLTKQWWMECKSRQTVVNLESWTEKFISPAIIANALTTVSDWAKTQETTSDDAITIKTNPRAHEITLSKELDAQLLSLAIHLPPTYPLGLATCHGLSRVAVDLKKWNTWILNTQGVIAFSDNSLIEGIIAFRRNVNGALKGQTECAICYSIVGADKQLPTKKCGTCKNLFHGSCLYRWFKSSNSSSCPLCRNPFNYT